jgi:hypothetical protein
MVGPIDGVRAIHNAFRADMAAIYAAAADAVRGTPGLETTVERFRFFNEILSYHAEGEQQGVFRSSTGPRPMCRWRTRWTTSVSTTRSKL